ncbi:hypothetical protein BDM02DRAFT_3109523 [Thelephora ganbajun]|uniref:Uncharacterized protein n=1 Tax=Thelephora ganbajun TaxID=370292 RepID=A0ACB6ZS34_THEGA|nr:hypothetical protein BDM02DRAFT_3109523 [Thelephora ganbajun]
MKDEDFVHPEPISSEPGRKDRKKKRKRDREDGEPPSDDKKKKRRKEKASGATSDPASAIPVTDLPHEAADIPEVTRTTAVASEVKERKKKHNSSTETSDPPTSSAIEPTRIAGSADKPEKPRKRKSTKDDDVDADGDAESSLESKPKTKKRKKREAVENEDNPSVVIPAEDSPRKRKKSKKPIHPDPSGDSDLTEQSQKALTYIYSQSTLPEIWKFNKARQNWIIRNVWTSKVPGKYFPMVVDYLSRVQGRVRETLIESCKKVISGSNRDPPVTQAGTDEKSLSENPNTSAPTNEKTERAETLLYALTKRS